ncbi:hypothetical protein RPMA_12615 [Tardiphaga alba]|uniref:Uncharacterized protein n=1 Tax=Tardiphaga alba TaxID=340268 RepID=A0ABX8A768_9BRAD|nr:hypothetical protein [Tardiphaga alba]QUS39586.1 hypothetical protein RPMA_12615 [Tardiphaga alba]
MSEHARLAMEIVAMAQKLDDVNEHRYDHNDAVMIATRLLEEAFPDHAPPAPAPTNATHSSHITRFSDSSYYDEVCTLCGATDANGQEKLSQPCPKAAHFAASTDEPFDVMATIDPDYAESFEREREQEQFWGAPAPTTSPELNSSKSSNGSPEPDAVREALADILDPATRYPKRRDPENVHNWRRRIALDLADKVIPFFAALSRPAHGGWEEALRRIRDFPHSCSPCEQAMAQIARDALARKECAPALDVSHFLCPGCGNDMRNPAEPHKADCEFIAFVKAKKTSAAPSDAVSGKEDATNG